MGHVYPRAIELVAQGRVRLAPIASHSYALEHSDDAFEAAARRPAGLLKAMIYPHGVPDTPA